jgi:NodT family efflux transporter outer membrane factor (OMF) lipoprotein
MKKTMLLLAAGSLLSACSSNYVPGPDVTLQPNYKFHKQKPELRSDIAPDTKWWTKFGDSTLNALIDEALASNISVEQARERIREARFNARIIKGGYFPSLNGSTAATLGETTTRSNTQKVTWVPNGSPIDHPHRGQWVPSPRQVTTDTSSASAGLAASWTLDFGARPSAEQQTYLIEAQKEALNSTRLDIIAGMTTAYLNVQGLSQQLAIAQKSLAVQNNTAEITKAKLEAGSVSALDSTRATAQAALTAADIPAIEQAREQAINQIAVLLGKEPAEVGNIFKYRTVRYPRVKFTAGIPADLLRNRPDVRVNQLQLQAQMAAIGVAEADQYPSITLSGNIGVTSAAGAKTGAWSFGPTINIPIFEGGRVRANINLNKSEARIAYLQYKQAVLNAVQDVDNALIAVKAEQERHARLTKAVADLTRAEQLAVQLNESGTTEFKDVLDAEADLYAAELELAQSTQQVNLNYVALSQALGGGWFGDEPVMAEDTITLAAKPEGIPDDGIKPAN